MKEPRTGIIPNAVLYDTKRSVGSICVEQSAAVCVGPRRIGRFSNSLPHTDPGAGANIGKADKGRARLEP